MKVEPDEPVAPVARDGGEGESRFRQMFDGAPQAIWICDRAGNITALNPAYTESFGYDLADASTLQSVLQRLFPDSAVRAHVHDAWLNALAEYRRTRRSGVPIIARMRCRDGRERVCEIRCGLAGNGDAIAIFNDITDRLATEEAQRKAQAERVRALSQLDLRQTRLPMALMMTSVDAEPTVIEWNPSAERIFGYRREEVIGRSPFGLVIPEDRRAELAALAGSRSDSYETVRIISQSTTKDGQPIWCEWFDTPVTDASGRIVKLRSMAQDVTDRVRAEGRMRLWNSVLDHSSEGIVICDAQGRIVLVNTAFERVTGYAESEVVGQTPRMLKSGRQDPAFYEAMWAAIAEDGHWHGELWNRRKSGEVYPEWLSINAVPDALGTSKHYVGIFSDISDRKAAEDRIAHMAQYDALTDLPNRALLTDRLAQLVAATARDLVKAAVLFVDLDHFKEVNDSMGHEAGDLLLIAVAKRLRGCLRGGDTVARMGGDEFVILLQHVVQPEDVATVAQKVLLAIKQPVLLGAQELEISASIGICIVPDDGSSAGQLIRNADAAMYRAKSSGRDAYRFYTRDMNERALERLSLESALRRAITRGELVLHYQPQIDLRSGAITGAEGLMRWNRPDEGLLMPARFLPLAEERGLIVPMGEWAIEEGARQAAAWDRAGIPITVAVNLSALQFHKRDFVEHVARTLAATRLAPERLELELTESVLIRDANVTITSLQRLHELGVVLSIDDFGTGYSSLNYLRRFPIDKIKIDKSFVDEVAHHVKTTRVIRAILALAKGFELEVVAEGVETEAQLATLCSEGCDHAQGYLFARPMPVDAFEAVWRGWRARPCAAAVLEPSSVECEKVG